MRYDPEKQKKHKWKIKPTLLSIITVNYNGYEDTCQMIESIQKHLKSVGYEIIVIDNASTKDEAYLLHKRFPLIRIVSSSENKGFAGGNNLGIPWAIGKYILFLNNDTYITEDHFQGLIDTLESSDDIAAVSPLIRYANEEDQPIQFAGFTPLSRFTLRNQSIGNGQLVSDEYLVKKEIPYLHGAAMLVKKEVIQETGLMPETYFLYYEEIDWSISMTQMGYKLYYEPCCTVYHKESRSTGVDSPLKVFFMMRSRFLFAYRNRNWMERKICFLYLLLLVFPRDCFKYLFNRRFDLILASIKGILSYFMMNKTEKLDNNEFKFSYLWP